MYIRARITNIRSPLEKKTYIVIISLNNGNHHTAGKLRILRVIPEAVPLSPNPAVNAWISLIIYINNNMLKPQAVTAEVYTQGIED